MLQAMKAMDPAARSPRRKDTCLSFFQAARSSKKNHETKIKTRAHLGFFVCCANSRAPQMRASMPDIAPALLAAPAPASCCFFLQGSCMHGATCELAHTYGDRCQFGERCRFGHQKQAALGAYMAFLR